jgi:hypothetical protein
LLYCSRARVLKIQRGVTSWSSSVELLGVQPFPTWGPFPFIVQGGALITDIKRCFFAPLGCSSSLSVVGAHLVGREWTGLILAIFWARDDPGDLLGQCIPPVLSHPCSVGAAQSLGWLLGGRLRSCPPEPTSLVRGAILRSSCHRMARPVRGVLPRSGRGRPVTLAGVMRRCVEATIITGGGSISGRPLPLCRGTRMSGTVPFSGSPAV